MSSISSRMEFLVKFGIIPAEAWDFIIPHGPKISKVAKEYLFAQIVRDIAKQVPGTKAASQLMDAGREMTNFAASGLVNGWEEGDDLCPPWFGHLPFPPRHHLENMLDGIESVQQQDTVQVYVSAMRYIAKNTTVKGAVAKLESAVKELDSISNIKALRSAA